MHGPPRLDHVLSNLLDGRVRANTCIQNFPDLVKGSTQVDRGWSGIEEVIKEGLEVVAQLEWRSQEIRLWILGKGCGDIRRH